MNTRKILLEEINRIRLISSYNAKNTSTENLNTILEFRGEGREVYRGLQDLLRTDREAFTAFKSELETITKDLKLVTDEGKQLKTGEEVLAAIRDGKISAESMVDLGASTFKQTQNTKLLDALAEDIVRSEKFMSDYRNLPEAEMIEKLSKSKMKIPKGSKQMESIIKANERVLADEAKTGFEEYKQGYKDVENYRDSRRYNEGPNRTNGYKEKPPMSEAEYREEVKEYIKNNPKIVDEVKSNPLGAWEKLKKSGLLIWKGGAWVVGNALWILLFGGLAYGVWQFFKGKTGAEREDDEGTSDDDHKIPEPTITDDEGNVYNPCTGVYRIGCVTTDSDGGGDFISQAQDCLGLSATGKFNKELETRLINKIHKRTFTKDDMKYICMVGGTLARL